MSKDLFALMRQQEIDTVNFLPSKKEIQFSAKEFISDILISGESNNYELFAQAKRMSEALEVVTTELLKSLPQENFESFGLKGTFRNGGDTVNFKEDEIWSDLQKQLKDREEILKLALKSSEPIFTEYGEVPKVSTTPRKSSLSITF